MTLKFDATLAIEQAKRLAGRGIETGAIWLSGRLKEVLSEPAPRKLVKGPVIGFRYYRATTRAAPGAPPRKLSGRLRASIAWAKIDSLTYRVGTGVVYGKFLELHKRWPHPWLAPTVRTLTRALRGIMTGGATARAVLKTLGFP